MMNLARNIRFGLRLLGKNLGFTCVALLALTLGIGANTAIFSVVYATLLAPLPYPNPDQLVIVWSKINGNRNGVQPATFWTGSSRAPSSRIFARGPAAITAYPPPTIPNSSRHA